MPKYKKGDTKKNMYCFKCKPKKGHYIDMEIIAADVSKDGKRGQIKCECPKCGTIMHRFTKKEEVK